MINSSEELDALREVVEDIKNNHDTDEAEVADIALGLEHIPNSYKLILVGLKGAMAEGDQTEESIFATFSLIISELARIDRDIAKLTRLLADENN